MGGKRHKVVFVRDLIPGDHFVWADDKTRERMNAKDNNILQVLEVVENGLDESYDMFRRIRVRRLDGTERNLYYDGPRNLYYDGPEVAVRMDDHCAPINLDVLCKCGNTAGEHYPGVDLRTQGWRCENGEEKWFVPDENSLREKYSWPGEDRFFAELGL